MASSLCNTGSAGAASGPIAPSALAALRSTCTCSPGTSQAAMSAGTARAASNALTGTGIYFSVELQNPTFNPSTGACTATLATYQSINSVVTQIWSTPVACHDGMQIRTALTTGSGAQITINGAPYGVNFSSALSTGMPGIGGRSMPSANAISMVELGPHDAIAPSPVNAQTFTPWITPGMVHVEWQGAVDNPNGTGILYYYTCRVGGNCFWGPDASFSDSTVQPGTTYTYQISAIDYHWNSSPATNLVVTTPTSTSTPNEHGIRPTNSYWGGAGEQIDVLRRQPELQRAANHSHRPRGPEGHLQSQLQLPELGPGPKSDT